MTGFEYAFAGLLISRGHFDDGIKVVSAVRNRYDGERRNPWNEFECGSNYARSMASFALVPIISGFEFDLPMDIWVLHPGISKQALPISGVWVAPWAYSKMMLVLLS